MNFFFQFLGLPVAVIQQLYVNLEMNCGKVEELWLGLVGVGICCYCSTGGCFG